MKNKKSLIIIALVILLSLFGITYAFFRYYKVGTVQKIVAGKVKLLFNEGTDTINLTNVFPETKEEARSRTDNAISFTISGYNTTKNQDIWYEIMLNEGVEEEGKTRYNPEHLVFDLIEISENNKETYLVDAMSFSEFNKTRIWVNTISRETSLELNKTYKLRMWLNNNVIISDTYEGADYTTQEFKNTYGSVKVSVYGDFIKKELPYNYMANLGVPGSTFWPESIETVKTNITEVNFVSMEQDLIDTRFESATIKEDVSDTTKGGSVKAWLQTNPLDSTKYIMYVASEGITFFPKNCGGMFRQFSGLTNINFENVNTSQVTTMQNMFSQCSSLANLDLSSFDTSQVTTMQNMFNGCNSLTSVDLSSFETSKVTLMDYMFYECRSLTSLDLSNFDTSSVTTIGTMFCGCTKLSELNLDNFNTEKVTTMSNMFYNCNSLTSLDLSSFDTSNVLRMISMFQGCSKLINLDLSNFDTSQVTYMNDMFYECSSLTSLDLSNFNTSQVTTMQNMFYECSSLTSLDLSHFDTSNVTTMGTMFYECKKLSELNLDNFNTENVTTMSNMFYNCNSLTSLNLSSFDTSNVLRMISMFQGCSKLINLDLSNFDTSQVTSMSNMFYGCSSLVGLDISNFTFDSVTSYSNIFYSMKARNGNTPTIIVKQETEQNWILALTGTARPSSWTVDNVIVKSSVQA